jgi:hypothetical protein
MSDRPNDLTPMDDRLPAGRDADDVPAACARFDELLPDLVEGQLSAADLAEADRHRAGCARCAALAADLESITRAAAALHTLRPERDLWAGIAERIDARVVPLDVRRAAAPGDGRRTYTFTRRWLGAAAAALIAVTSGATYLATRTARDAASPTVHATPQVATAAAPETPAGDAPPADAAAGTATDPATDPATEPTPAAEAPTAQRAPRPAPRAQRPDARLAANARGTTTADAAAAEYDREISALRVIVRQRRGELDSTTVRVLEENLRLIDRAITQSRAALARDPSSQFLGEQLTRALDSKVELLRTVALLRPRGA